MMGRTQESIPDILKEAMSVHEAPRENPMDILKELYERCRLTQEQRQDYEQRITKALWRDRAEVVKAITGETEGGKSR